jgi:hypothetical protein
MVKTWSRYNAEYVGTRGYTNCCYLENYEEKVDGNWQEEGNTQCGCFPLFRNSADCPRQALATRRASCSVPPACQVCGSRVPHSLAVFSPCPRQLPACSGLGVTSLTRQADTGADRRTGGLAAVHADCTWRHGHLHRSPCNVNTHYQQRALSAIT